MSGVCILGALLALAALLVLARELSTLTES